MVRGLVSTESRADIYSAIQDGLRDKTFSPRDIKLLDLYISGYTSNEIAIEFMLLREEVEATLIRVLKAIEERTQYLDDIIIQRIFNTHQVTKEQKDTIIHWFVTQGELFETHELPTVRVLRAKKD